MSEKSTTKPVQKVSTKNVPLSLSVPIEVRELLEKKAQPIESTPAAQARLALKDWFTRETGIVLVS
jgi:hypothetical protein